MGLRIVRIVAWVMLALMIVASSLYIFRLPLAGYGVRAAMANAGLAYPRAKVTALSTTSIRLEQVAAGPEGAEGFYLETIDADFSINRLLSERSVEAIAVGPGALRLRISSDGAVSLPGVSLGGEGSGRGAGGVALPFDRFTLRDIALSVDAPEGGGTGALSAEYDVEQGGGVTFSARSNMAGWKSLRVENTAVDVDLQLASDGEAQLSAMVSGDAFSPDGAMREASIKADLSGGSWRDAAAGQLDAYHLKGRIQLENAHLPVAQAPKLAALSSAPLVATLFGEGVNALTVSADAMVELTPARVALTLAPGEAARLGANNGAALAITGISDAPFFMLDADGMRANAAFALAGAPLSAEGRVIFAPLADGWRIEAPARISAFESSAVAFQDADIELTAEALPGRVRAGLSIQTLVSEAAMGPATLYDTPVAAALTADVDLDNALARIALEGDCLALPRLRITSKAPALESAITQGRFCPQGNDLAVIDWSGDLTLTSKGVLTAQRAQITMGETRFTGAPPRIDADVQVNAATGASVLKGGFSGGRVVFNESLIFSAADGDFTLSLDALGMRGDARVDHVRAAQNLEAPLVAPIIASGAGELADNVASFTYAAYTPGGAPLGRGEGRHHLETGRGEAAFTIDALTFSPDGLQPETLTPVLRGVIDNASGDASGMAQFAWAPDTLTSSAEIAVNNITFAGPTRVVTQTRGLDGALRFSSLWPVATDGEQTITVDLVDLDALVMEAGEVVFEMPGDDSVRIARASFPWFGGSIGVYEATASYADGGAALAPLRAESIDMRQVLEFVDVDGLSGEGLLSGVLPLVVEGGRASIEGGLLQSDGPGVLRYESAATNEAAATGGQAQIAFDLLRDLRYNALSIAVNGPLDGRLDFQLRFEGSGEVSMNNQDARVPVIYNINLDAALLELLNQANLTRDIQLQFQRGLGGETDGEDAAKE